LRRNDEDIPWDKHGFIPTESGLVNPRTGEVRSTRPDDYCTWRIPFKYDQAAECPDWLQMLNDTFADRDDQEKADTILVIQEVLGVGLIDEKPKALSRALIFQGGSNFGKSAMIEVMAALFGKGVNTADFKSLEGAHGMSALLRRRPWVLHEAFDQLTWHFSSNVKAIISNEPVQINPKNRDLISMRVTAPIFWGTNHPPQFKESTKAIVNRLVIIRCNRELLPEQPVGVGVKAWRQRAGQAV
jgi:putative DNA primase/helicase